MSFIALSAVAAYTRTRTITLDSARSCAVIWLPTTGAGQQQRQVHLLEGLQCGEHHPRTSLPLPPSSPRRHSADALNAVRYHEVL